MILPGPWETGEQRIVISPPQWGTLIEGAALSRQIREAPLGSRLRDWNLNPGLSQAHTFSWGQATRMNYQQTLAQKTVHAPQDRGLHTDWAVAVSTLSRSSSEWWKTCQVILTSRDSGSSRQQSLLLPFLQNSKDLTPWFWNLFSFLCSFLQKSHSVEKHGKPSNLLP